MGKEVEAKFQRTVANLLAMPPERQPVVARVRRRNKFARKAEIAEIEALIAISRAHSNLDQDDMDDEEVFLAYVSASPRITTALQEFLRLKLAQPPRTVNE